MEKNTPEWIPRVTVIEGERTRRHFWQPGGGYDRKMEKDRTLLATIDDIHENPVRRGLVERVTDWEWSSVQWYAGETDVHLKIDKALPMFEE